jgi:Tfp pilus assembly protein PilO
MAASWQTQGTKYQQYLITMVALYRRRPDLKAYLELLLSLATIAVLGLFAIRPTALTITQLLTDISNKRETARQMTKKIEDLNTAQNLMLNQKANIALLQKAIPTGAAPEDYERQIEGIATKNGVTLTTTSIDPTLIKGEGDVAGTKASNNSAITTIPLPAEAKGMKLSFIITGSYQQVSSFLKDIENERRPIVLDDVSLSSANGEQSLTLTVTGRVTYQ